MRIIKYSLFIHFLFGHLFFSSTCIQAQPICNTGCPSTIKVYHVTGAISPETVEITYNTVQTNLAGSGDKCWITQNLGAISQATSPTDASYSVSGWYWQYSRKQGFKYDGTKTTPASVWNATNTSGWDVNNDPCLLLLGTGWRIPTYAEWYFLDTNQSWGDVTDVYNSVLKLHIAGYLYNGTGAFISDVGYYWSSGLYSSTNAYALHFTSSLCNTDPLIKASGLNVRCLRDL